jgi:hypothetical protein
MEKKRNGGCAAHHTSEGRVDRRGMRGAGRQPPLLDWIQAAILPWRAKFLLIINSDIFITQQH